MEHIDVRAHLPLLASYSRMALEKCTITNLMFIGFSSPLLLLHPNAIAPGYHHSF
jgi:hypothetical protein